MSSDYREVVKQPSPKNKYRSIIKRHSQFVSDIGYHSGKNRVCKKTTYEESVVIFIFHARPHSPAYGVLTLELNIKKTVGNTRFAPCFQRFFCTLILDSSLNSILLHSETESKSCSV